LTTPDPSGPLEHHAFEGNPLKMSKLERLTPAGWIEIGVFPATADGLLRAARRYQRERKRPGLMGVALWIGPTLAACEMAQSIRRFYKSGAPAATCPILVVDGETAE
jgi:hypothetical protein